MYPYLNATILDQADLILRSGYPGGDILPNSKLNDQIARFFISPVMALLFRNLMVLFLSDYIQDQVKFFKIHAPDYAYYMTPEWLLNRYLFERLTIYSTSHYHNLRYVNEDQVKIGERYGMMIIESVNFPCHKKETCKEPYWLDVKIKQNIEFNRSKPPEPDKRAFHAYHLWLNKTSVDLYHGAVLNSIAF